jgi:NADH-quinone oxidoreductase subunit N
LSSAVLLYGLSFWYGVTGSLAFDTMREAPEFSPLVKLAAALIFAGLCFKITAVPFHFYAPDVYQGTNYPNVAVLSVAPKLAGLVALLRIFETAPAHLAGGFWQVAVVVAVLTMTLGNVLALWQTDLRRLFAYSSIANAGYMLIGFATSLTRAGASGDWNGASSLLFYWTAYAAATIGAFAVLEYLGRPDRSLDGVEELAGLGRTHPLMAALLAWFLFSLTGVPPLAGFWGKLVVFGSALSVGGAWFTTLAVVGALNAAVAAAYYLRIVAVMYFRTPLGTPKALGGRGAWWAAVACACLIALIGNVFWPWLR